MLKKTIYPKTTRLGKDTSGVLITEKLDGANLSFLKDTMMTNYILHKETLSLL